MCRLEGQTLLNVERPTKQQGLAAQQALRRFHNRGFWHGDVAYRNIFITKQPNSVRLLDFGNTKGNAPSKRQSSEERQLIYLFEDKVCQIYEM
jgi:tRNA A-37 threonylcarbamoyl transferase component Bud32